MWTKFRASRFIWISVFADVKHQIRNKPQKSFNVNEEYLCALRSRSFVEFFAKAQLIVQESPPSTSSSADLYCRKFSETILLQSDQLEANPSILESPLLVMLPELRGLLIDFFNVSAEASNLCHRLLANLKLARSNSRFVQKLLDSIEKCSSPKEIETITSDLLAQRAPLSDLDKRDFARIHDDYAAVSRSLNITRKKVARKIRSIKIIDRFTCGLVAITSRGLTALVMAADQGPVLRYFRLKSIRRKLLRHQMLGNGGLERVGEQLEAAAKGSYILNREFDTTSRLVVRLGDAVDHGKAMVRLFVERKEDKFAVAVAMDEMKRSNVSIRKQVEDVEEHLYLCFVTINRSRASVINQM
ncbi:UPF0496 protein 3, partial [Cucurbita argyrosperma subsp. sororia]